MQEHFKSFKAESLQRDSPASPYLRPSISTKDAYLEEDLESNDSGASNLSFATALISGFDSVSTASFATAPSMYSCWSESDGIGGTASLEKQAQALANDPDSIIEALTRCEILASTNVSRAISIAKDIMDTCIELLSNTHVFLVPIRTTLGSLYIKAEQFQDAENELQAARAIWQANQSDEHRGVEQILFPLGVVQLALKKYLEAEETLRNCMIKQLSFLDFDSEECISTVEMLAIATVSLGMIEDSRALLDSSLEYREKNGIQITCIHEGQATCLGTVLMTSIHLLKLYIDGDQLEMGLSFLENLAKFFVAHNVSDVETLIEMIGGVRKLASFFTQFDDPGAAEGMLSSWLSKSESLLGSSHPAVIQLMFDLSENYAIQSREDEAEALSGAASERLKIALANSDAPTTRDDPLAKLNKKSLQQKENIVLKQLVPSDVELWFNTIQKLNLQPTVASSDILQCILRMNLAPPDEVSRMLPYATHLKIAAFARIQKR